MYVLKKRNDKNVGVNAISCALIRDDFVIQEISVCGDEFD
jgi:hypothetical protein